ncbi:hypothetical protein AAFC00_006750 [Neodothiora populina]|uniref:Uncharacterized protein n=1 Tax=Neodothiora populina TaxID=2781224 RepID=A0ABR3PBQ4_9PEZI
MMEGSMEDNRRQSRLYSLSPVVTTNLGLNGVPTPPLSPSLSASTMSCIVRPPTHGGGPLSSHPTTPIDMPGAWVSTTDLQAQVLSNTTNTDRIERRNTQSLNLTESPRSSASPSVSAEAEPSRHDSFRTPMTPASANNNQQRRGSKTVRKLLSLSGLRNSFIGGSNTSLSDPSSVFSPNHNHNQHQSEGESDQQSQGLGFTTACTSSNQERPSSRLSSFGLPQGTKRAASTSMPSTSSDDKQSLPRSPLRKKKSTGWFRRTSQILFSGQDNSSQHGLSSRESRSPSASTEGKRAGSLSSVNEATTPAASSRPQLSHTPSSPHVSKARRLSRNFLASDDHQARSSSLGQGQVHQPSSLQHQTLPQSPPQSQPKDESQRQASSPPALFSSLSQSSTQGSSSQNQNQPPRLRPHTSQPSQTSQTFDIPSIQEPPRTSHSSKPTLLPEIDTLAGGRLDGGYLGAEDMFANIGR